MSLPNRPSHGPLLFVGVLIISGLLLMSATAQGTSNFRTAIALLLLVISALSFHVWRLRGSKGLPVFSILVFCLWNAYGLPCLTGSDDSISVVGRRVLSEASYDKTMILVLIGVVSLGLGMTVRFGRLSRSGPTLIPTSLTYLRAVLIISIAAIALNTRSEMGASPLRAALLLLQFTTPMIALGILLQAILQGLGTKFDIILGLAFVAATFIRGLGSGWLGPGITTALFIALIYLFEKKRIPWVACVLALLAAAFFQVGKSEYRKTYWNGGGAIVSSAPKGFLGGAAFWFSQSYSQWRDALTSPMGDGAVPKLLSKLGNRTSLYTQTANVVELTPEIIPYQGGKLYSYLFVSWIPRFLWPGKPSMSEANQFYQRVYLGANERDLETSIAVGFLAESYITYGIPGLVAIMFLVGCLLSVLQSVCLRSDSGSFLHAIGLVLLLHFIQVESQMAQMLSNVLQIIIISLLVFFPVLRRFHFPRDVQPSAAEPQLTGASKYPMHSAGVM